MTTDFTYGGKQIVISGPIKPNGKDMPSDARTRVESYADIASIPNPHVGLKITVKVDETNNNKMTDYIVKSLKANSMGVADSVIDEVVRYVDYLGVNTSGGGTGLTTEQAQQLQVAYEHSQTTHVQASDIPSLEGYATETFVTNNYASKNHNHSEYASSSHRHDASEIDNLPSGGSISKDDINTAVNDYLTKNPVSGGATAEQAAQIQANKTAIDKLTPLNFDNLTVNETLTSNVDETIIKQEYLGGYIEIQPDSWDGTTIVTGDKSDGALWGFPISLKWSEREKIKNEILTGNNKNIMFIRFPLGFAYRGYRNIDETSRLAKNIGERFSGQNSSLKKWFENIVKSGGGLAPEYWCPAPYWTTGGAYGGETNYICAGGSYSKATTLQSIKTSDITQYNKQIDDFTNAIVDDLEYLHQNIAPVRMFGLQNEPKYASAPYGACNYDSQTYNDVLSVLYPKILNSVILSTYDGEKNDIKLLVASSDEGEPFNGIASTFISNHKDMIWGYTFHNGSNIDSSNHYNYIKNLGGTNIFVNEYEYFRQDTMSESLRFAKNVYRILNELIYGESKVIHPIIHICKPIGQTSSMTYSEGYCLYLSNLDYDGIGLEPGDSANTYNLAKGTTIHNNWSYNSWQVFGQNLPINSYMVGSYAETTDNCKWVIYKYENKLYIIMVNIGESWIRDVKLTFNKSKRFKGKYYNINNCGTPIQPKQGTTIDFIIPQCSALVWEEDETYVASSTVENIDCTDISISPSSLTFTDTNNQIITTTVTPTNTTDTVSYTISPTGIINLTSDGKVTPIANGSATITATCGTKTATCSVTVNLPTLSSITATYTQGSTIIYPSTSLDSLKSNLVVTANYSDSTTSTITSYTLSGTLSVGTSTITVSYSGKTTTFDVNVIEESTLSSITANYTQGDTIVYPSTSLDSLKDNLVVTATYSDGTTSTVSDYTLSGTLSVGTSTITVSYSGKTTTFDVTVSEQAISSEDYTTDSLVAYFDCRNDSTGNYNFSKDRKIWYDLTGNDHNINTEYSGNNVQYVANEYGLRGTTAVTSRTINFDGSSLPTSYSFEFVLQIDSTNKYNLMRVLIVNENTSISIGNKFGIPYTFTADNRYHILFTVNGSNVNIYINNTLHRTYTDYSFSNWTSEISLPTSKTLSVLRIYSKELTSDEVTKNYNNCVDLITV